MFLNDICVHIHYPLSMFSVCYFVSVHVESVCCKIMLLTLNFVQIHPWKHLDSNYITDDTQSIDSSSWVECHTPCLVINTASGRVAT